MVVILSEFLRRIYRIKYLYKTDIQVQARNFFFKASFRLTEQCSKIQKIIAEKLKTKICWLFSTFPYLY